MRRSTVEELSDEYLSSWAVLVDKGYQGATAVVRAIQPKKNQEMDR
jgi:hypothetical protein